MAVRAPISRPGLAWRAFVIGGIGGMKALSFSDTAWAWWEEHVTDAVPRSAVQGALGATLALHVAEAAVAWRVARRAGLPHAGAYARTTLVYGFPALGRTRQAAASMVVGDVVDLVVEAALDRAA